MSIGSHSLVSASIHICATATRRAKVLGGVTAGFGDNKSKGGKNRADGQGWWASMTESTVSIGDTLLMREGVLLIYTIFNRDPFSQ